MGPFVRSTQLTFSTMLETNVGDGQVFHGSGLVPVHEFSAILGLGGEFRGALVLSCPAAVARSIAAKLVHEEAPDLEVIVDALGELVNVIAGAAKPALRILGYDDLALSLPTVVVGGSHKVFRKREVNAGLVIFDSPLGPFSLQACLATGRADAHGPVPEVRR